MVSGCLVDGIKLLSVFATFVCVEVVHGGEAKRKAVEEMRLGVLLFIRAAFEVAHPIRGALVFHTYVSSSQKEA